MKCQWCGLMHETKCPLVKSIEYHPDGAMKRVEFMTPRDNQVTMAPITSPHDPLNPFYRVFCGPAYAYASTGDAQ